MNSNNENEKSYLDIFNEYMNQISAESNMIEDEAKFELKNKDNAHTAEEEVIEYSFEEKIKPPMIKSSPIRRPEKVSSKFKRTDTKTRHKGLKWLLMPYMNFKTAIAALLILVVIITIAAVSCSISGGKSEEVATTSPETTVPTTVSNSYQIPNVNVISQDALLAGCETYACTMLLQYLNYDIDEFQFADNYLITAPMSWDENGTRYGPDMDSAFAGDIYTGFGINAPAMAKSMNKYLETTDKNQKAYNITGTSLEDMCEEYIKNNIPVMVWATARMDEPYIDRTWVVNYVDENAKTEIGDTVGWYEHEHCLLLVGYDETNYYFCDSLEGQIMGYERKITETRYSQLGSQSIVVK